MGDEGGRKLGKEARRKYHGEQSWAGVLELEVLIFKGPPVDAEDASSISLDKIASLDHEVLDHPVKLSHFEALGLVVHPVFSRAQLPAKKQREKEGDFRIKGLAS